MLKKLWRVNLSFMLVISIMLTIMGSYAYAVSSKSWLHFAITTPGDISLSGCFS